MILDDVELQRDLQRCITGYIAGGDWGNPNTPNVLRGGCIIMYISWLEESWPDINWRDLHNPEIRKPFDWWGWPILLNFHKLRNSFSHHAEGTIWEEDHAYFLEFHQKLQQQEIKKFYNKSEKEEPVEEYYHIDNDRIILEDSAIQECLAITAKCYLEIPE